MFKMTLISVTFRGVRTSKFVNALYVNGKAVVDASVYAEMAASIGCGYGQTYTIS